MQETRSVVVVGVDCSAKSGKYITTWILNVSNLPPLAPNFSHWYTFHMPNNIFPILSPFVSQIINISSPRKTCWIFLNFKAKTYLHLQLLPFYVCPVLPTWQLCRNSTTRSQITSRASTAYRTIMFLCGYRGQVPLLSTHEISFNLGSIGAAERRIVRYLWLATYIYIYIYIKLYIYIYIYI